MKASLIVKHRRSCADKRSYPTPAEAEQERRRHGYVLYVYKCPWGDHYHLTRQAQRRQR